LVGAGVLAIIISLGWHQFFPINKPLWTSSYVLYTAGIACVLLSIFLWMVEYKGWKKWASPFIVFGMNPLFIYALSIIWVKVMLYILKWDHQGETINAYSWIYRQIFVPIAGELNGSLFFALSYVAILWLIAWIMWKKKIFVKV
jgi:predicted acyltransferase